MAFAGYAEGTGTEAQFNLLVLLLMLRTDLYVADVNNHELEDNSTGATTLQVQRWLC
jgi:hypothetical protein